MAYLFVDRNKIAMCMGKGEIESKIVFLGNKEYPGIFDIFLLMIPREKTLNSIEASENV